MPSWRAPRHPEMMQAFCPLTHSCNFWVALNILPSSAVLPGSNPSMLGICLHHFRVVQAHWGRAQCCLEVMRVCYGPKQPSHKLCKLKGCSGEDAICKPKPAKVHSEFWFQFRSVSISNPHLKLQNQSFRNSTPQEGKIVYNRCHCGVVFYDTINGYILFFSNGAYS